MKILLQMKNRTKGIPKPPSVRTFHLIFDSRLPPLHRRLIVFKSSSYSSLQPPTNHVAAAAAFSSMAGVAELDLTGAPTAALIDKFFNVKLQPRVIVYDGVCHLFHRGMKWITSVDEDKKIKFCCLQSKTTEPYLAVLKVLSYMPLPYSALSSLLVLLEPLKDNFYDYLANKGCERLGKEDDCIELKEIELLDRFIDADELWKRKLVKGL